MRALSGILLVMVVASAGAQGTKAPAKPDSSKAPATKAGGTKAPDTKAAGTKAPETKGAVPTPPNTKQQDSKQAAAPNTKATDTKAGTKAADTKTGTKAADTKTADTKTADTKQAQGGAAPAPGTKAPAANTKQAGTTPPAQPQLVTPSIMREVYAYDVEGRRDPFISLLTSSSLRPTVADLYLTSILYDENGSNSIAMMRDPTDGNKQYRVVTGQTIGRMKVALIKRKVVIFSIEEFGTNRQDSLVLGDTTKVRAK
jgi:hypothetical protein